MRMAIRKMRTLPYTDCYRYMHPDEDGYTFPTPDPNVRLDYVFMSALLKPRLRSCEVVTDISSVLEASDHYPLVADYASA